MATPLPRTKAELRNRPTSYEVAAFFSDGTSVRLGFTSRVTKMSLIAIARKHGDYLLSMMTEADADAEWRYSRKDGLRLGNARVAPTGNTEFGLAE